MQIDRDARNGIVTVFWILIMIGGFVLTLVIGDHSEDIRVGLKNWLLK